MGSVRNDNGSKAGGMDPQPVSLVPRQSGCAAKVKTALHVITHAASLAPSAPTVQKPQNLCMKCCMQSPECKGDGL
jgi:hypothetical protein